MGCAGGFLHQGPFWIHLCLERLGHSCAACFCPGVQSRGHCGSHEVELCQAMIKCHPHAELCCGGCPPHQSKEFLRIGVDSFP